MKKALKNIMSYISMTASIIAVISALVGYLVGQKVTQRDVERLNREMAESYKLHYQAKEVMGRALQYMGE